jgi:hypothetical protein
MTSTGKNSVIENSTLLKLSFSKIGASRKADLSKVTMDGDKTRHRLSKILYSSAEYAAIGKFDGEVNRLIASWAIPCNAGFRGISILPLKLMERADKFLAEAIAKRKELVQKFVDVFPAEINEARVRLRDQFSEDDYPKQADIQELFKMSYAYITFKVPDNLPDEVKKRESDKLTARFSEVEADVRDAMRDGLAKLVKHLVESLQVGDDGKQKIFRNSSVNNLVEFLELFNDRNITNDRDLEQLANKAREVIAGVDPDSLRSKTSIRDSVKTGLVDVSTALNTLITTSGSGRKFSFDEE